MAEISMESEDACRADSSGAWCAGPASTLVEVLCRRAAAAGECAAYTFLVDDEAEGRTLSYGALESQARRIAVALAGRGGSPARAVLLYDPGLDFVAGLFGCFFAGVVAVPVFPPDPRDVEAGLRRIQRLAADADAAFVLTTDAMWAWIEPWVARVPALMQLEWCATDALSVGSEAAWQRPILADGDVAFLQYTSGSTGTPKGVKVTHGNVMAHTRSLEAALALSADSILVGWLPLYHDMGLIGTVLTPMRVGCRSVQMSPWAFVERPLRWLEAISRYRGTVSPAPNFAYDLCVRRTASAERRGLDLSTWVAAMNGAEPVRPETCERFVAAFEPYGFRRESFVPCYGLAEATLMVAGGPLGTGPVLRSVDGAALERHLVVDAAPGAPGARTIVGCGHVLAGHEAIIVQPDTGGECGRDEVGEIWVAGASIAGGYWGRAEDTAAVFGAHEAGSGRGPFLRTGDLGFVRDGVLFVTGRQKDLIVVRGRNYYPQDIERTVEASHAALRPGCGAVFSLDDGVGEQLAIVHEVGRLDGVALDGVFAAIRHAVAREHQLSAHRVGLIRPGALPKTSSGKVRRQACRAALEAGMLDVVGAWPASTPPGDPAPIRVGAAGDSVAAQPMPSAEDIGNWLVTTIAALRDVPRERVRKDEALIALGVDSAEAAEVAARLHEWLVRPVPLRFFREHPTIEALARALSGGAA
jgi:acyl-CoA synthetase (AMP-forming)/AMP-acid ligase II